MSRIIYSDEPFLITHDYIENFCKKHNIKNSKDISISVVDHENKQRVAVYVEDVEGFMEELREQLREERKVKHE